ncbi:hypothetical protein CH381_29520 [Leptospira sp. mixed culture ATI2-C-A1]|nr:hypothetical protein CH381_29520 [Leptospira sp. mixed culture ATI2-C-A1]
MIDFRLYYNTHYTMKKTTLLSFLILTSLLDCSGLSKTANLKENLNPAIKILMAEEIILVESETEPTFLGSLRFNQDNSITTDKKFSIPHISEICNDLRWEIPEYEENSSKQSIVQITCIKQENKKENYFLYLDYNTFNRNKYIEKGYLIHSSSPRYKNVSTIYDVEKYEGDSIYFSKNIELANRALEDFKKRNYEENKIYIEDNEQLKRLTLDLSEFQPNENDTQMKLDDKKTRKLKFINSFKSKQKGKLIKFHSLLLKDIIVEKELTNKGKKMEQEMKIISEKMIFKMATETEISKATQLYNDLKKEYTGNEYYIAEFKLSEKNPVLDPKFKDVLIYKQFSKKSALELDKGNEYKIEGRVTDLVYSYSHIDNSDELWKIFLN